MRASALLIIPATAVLGALLFWQPEFVQHGITLVDDTVMIATRRVVASRLAGPSAALALANDGRVIGASLTEETATVLGVVAAPLPSVIGLMLVCALVSGSSGCAVVFSIGLVMGLSAMSETEPQRASSLIIGSYTLCSTLVLPRPAQMVMAAAVAICIGVGETNRLLICAATACFEAVGANGAEHAHRVGVALLCAVLIGALSVPPALQFIYAEMRLGWLRLGRGGATAPSTTSKRDSAS